MLMMSLLYSAEDATSSGNWLTLFKDLMLNVTMLTMFLHLSNFGLGLSCAVDFSNIGTRYPIWAERAPCLPARRTMRFGHTF